jgi:hypothetical protein
MIASVWNVIVPSKEHEKHKEQKMEKVIYVPACEITAPITTTLVKLYSLNDY